MTGSATVALSAMAFVVSLAAFLLSAFSFFNGRETRKREWRIDAKITSNEASRLLGEIVQEVSKLRLKWDALLSASGLYHSGQREKSVVQEKIWTVKVFELFEELEGYVDAIDEKSDAELEERLVRLQDIRVQAQKIRDEVAADEAEYTKQFNRRLPKVGPQ